MPLISYDINRPVSARLASVALLSLGSTDTGKSKPFDFLTNYLPGVDNEIVVVKGANNVHRIQFNRFDELGRVIPASFDDVTSVEFKVSTVSVRAESGSSNINWSIGNGYIDFDFGMMMSALDAGVYRPQLSVHRENSSSASYVLHPALREDFQIKLVGG